MEAFKETGKVQPLVPNNMDKVLIQELNELSLVDREAFYEEVHGAHAQSVAKKERPGKIAEALNKMQFELGNIPDHEKRAYTMAIEQQDGRYVRHTKFLLKFLRAENYDSQKAAYRMLSYLQYLHDSFGLHVLSRPVYQRDLSPASTRIMREEGILQLLPFRDGSGRRVAVFLGIGDSATTFPEVHRVSFQLISSTELTASSFSLCVCCFVCCTLTFSSKGTHVPVFFSMSR
jgi:hypothetical protein